MAVLQWGSMNADNTYIQFHTDLSQSLGNTNANINPTPLRVGLISLAVRRVRPEGSGRSSLRNVGWAARGHQFGARR